MEIEKCPNCGSELQPVWKRMPVEISGYQCRKCDNNVYKPTTE